MRTVISCVAAALLLWGASCGGGSASALPPDSPAPSPVPVNPPPGDLCGNGSVDPGEECDGGNLNGATCASHGFTGGTLSCAAECKFDIANCTGTPPAGEACGNGVIEGSEQCDDGNTATEACAYGEASCTVCNAACETQAGATSLCDDSAVDSANEQCDDGNTVTEACAYGRASCTVCNATCETQAGATSLCGDGNLDRANGELCDDGANNSNLPDACRTDCTSPRCGDLVTDSGELCDDGPANNDSAFDSCKTDCSGRVPAVCGNSVREGTEQCDDGDTVTNICAYGQTSCTVCNSTCGEQAGATSYCGDSTRDALNGEECDQGFAGNNDFNADACRTNCRNARCGDWVIDSGEICDEGTNNSDTAFNSCKTDCSGRVPAICGNGIPEGPEQCDQGAANSDTNPDACRTNCTSPRCGDSVADSGELCDDGNQVDTDACLTTCRQATCGDGVVQDGVEVCDDNNTASGDGCRGDCQKIERCGDGNFDQTNGEQCDDGNVFDTDACPTTCRSAFCGDGFWQIGLEQCDDGNAFDTDDCPTTCRYAFCGDGFVRAGGSEDCDGSNMNQASCPSQGFVGGTIACSNCRFDTTACTMCGNGNIDAGEQCDGANLNGAACSTFGFTGGTPTCGGTCQLNTSTCIDGLAPQNTSLAINGGATYSVTPDLTLSLSADDSIGVVGYFILESDTPPAASDPGWVEIIPPTANYAENAAWPISAVEGPRTLYAWFKDAAGNISGSASDSIVLDMTPPQVDSSFPLNNSLAVDRNVKITVRFDEAVLPPTGNYITVQEGANSVAGAISYDAQSTTSTFTPASPLEYSKNYTVAVGFGLADLAGNPLAPDSFSFTTIEIPAPTGLAGFAGPARADLSWNGVDGAAGYNLYQSTSSGFVPDAANRVNPSPILSTSYRHSNLADNTIHYYRVTAIDSSGNESLPSSEVMVWIRIVWSFEEVVGADVGNYASMALDSAGNVHIVYYDSAGQDLKYIAKINGVWQAPTTIESNGNTGQFCDLAIDRNNNLHVIYYDTNDVNRWWLWYAYKSAGGSFWFKEIVDSSVHLTFPPSLAVDGNMVAHISYSNGDVGSHLRVAEDTPQGWVMRDFTNPEFQSVTNTCIAADNVGNIYIVYNRAGNLLYIAKPSGYDLDGWQPEYGPVGVEGKRCSMTLALGNLHVASLTAGGSPSLYYTLITPSFPPDFTAPSPSLTAFAGDQKTDIAVDADGDVHLLYSTTSALTYKTATMVSTVDGTGQYPASLALDASGNVHLAYPKAGKLIYGKNFE